ncbi:hypothetical protein GGR58DRAFT_502113 [Xylaria digitata]|nr:hypothetical protein GGR58DRAFT_502113 [Xylaria digitata]
MVGAGGANANADADATSSRFGSKEEDANATPSSKASNLPRRTAASLSRDGDDKLDCHRTVACDRAGKQARGRTDTNEVAGKVSSFLSLVTLFSLAKAAAAPRRDTFGCWWDGWLQAFAGGVQGRQKSSKGEEKRRREPGFWKMTSPTLLVGGLGGESLLVI